MSTYVEMLGRAGRAQAYHLSPNTTFGLHIWGYAKIGERVEIMQNVAIGSNLAPGRDREAVAFGSNLFIGAVAYSAAPSDMSCSPTGNDEESRALRRRRSHASAREVTTHELAQLLACQ
ncbi:MAG: hypothetical protein JWQ89_3498 [Devosia sp.]|uniref:hypothetical protein n=1 Tax=Devosia sp. TaxID=1871048 RepID=UPI00261A6EAC|nr:hypothetical protein [Devosia sp.]MDB5541771.1 hypothetical protein [Devosia sp.]